MINLLKPFEHATQELLPTKYTTKSILIPEKLKVGDFLLATSLKPNFMKDVDIVIGSVDETTMLAAATITGLILNNVYNQSSLLRMI